MMEMPAPESGSEARRDDLLALLDRELGRLPDKYRVLIILCDLEGKTHRKPPNNSVGPLGRSRGGCPGQDDAGQAVVPSWHVAIGRVVGRAAGQGFGGGQHADPVDRSHGSGRKPVCGVVSR